MAEGPPCRPAVGSRGSASGGGKACTSPRAGWGEKSQDSPLPRGQRAAPAYGCVTSLGGGAGSGLDPQSNSRLVI